MNSYYLKSLKTEYKNTYKCRKIANFAEKLRIIKIWKKLELIKRL